MAAKTKTRSKASGRRQARLRLPGRQRLRSMYRTMKRIRLFEEAADRAFQSARMIGELHFYIGEEATATGVCAALRDEDYITSTHRGHGHCIAKGGRLDMMMAELFGRATGYCGGKGGSMHIADLDLGILGANGIVGGGLPMAPGAAYGSKLKGDGRVTVSFFGDGAVATGAFHESVNFASLHDLPLVYVCENNQYAMASHVSNTAGGPGLAARAESYGVPATEMDGNDVVEVFETTRKAVARARAGRGPSFLIANTYRHRGHTVAPDPPYRSDAEVTEWMARDPIERFRRDVIAARALTVEQLDGIDAEVEREAEQALEFAESSPYPDVETLLEGVYVDLEVQAAAPAPAAPLADEKRMIFMSQAIREALDEELTRDPTVFMFGEEIGQWGGAYGVTRGLLDKHGPARVLDTPISEALIAGAAVGASITGMRPVAEFMFQDFMGIAMDQIANQAAKNRYMFGGKNRLPIVYRAAYGAGRSQAAQHSQSLEAWFTHVPGLKVVTPSNAYDAKGLLKAAIRDDDVVAFFEHKALYQERGHVPEGDYEVPIGVAEVKRIGSDATIVSYARQLQFSLQAAGQLATEGIDVEVVDLRTLYPPDMNTVLASVRKTSRAMVVHEAVRFGGLGGEISAQIQELAFDSLDAPIKRLGAEHAPIPCAAPLELASYPSVESIMRGIRELMQGV